MKAVLLDIDYTVDENGTEVVLYLKGKKTRFRRKILGKPYFIVEGVPLKEVEEAADLLGREVPITGLEEDVRFFGKEGRKVVKVFVDIPPNVPKVKHVLKEKLGRGNYYEFDIPFKKRFLMDLSITPLDIIAYEREGKEIKKLKSSKESNISLSFASFDIEVYNPQGMPNPKEDPIIIISYKGKEEAVISTRKLGNKGVEAEDEKGMLRKLDEVIEKESPDILLGYNSSQFDLPYIEERAKKLRVPLKLLERKRKVHRGMIDGYRLYNHIHIDLYHVSRLLATMGAIEAERMTLEEVYKAVSKKAKKMVQRLDMWKLWDEGEDELLGEYALGDAIATYEIGKELLPLEVELARMAKATLFDVSLSTSGQLVESRLMFFAAKEKHIIPPKPKEDEIRRRFANPIQGAFVKLPEPGIYNDVAVLDFRGLYPSIIISYNIDPFTLTQQEDDVHISPAGHKFLKEPKGLVPRVLEEILEVRGKIKKKMKEVKSEDEYKTLYARSWALKVLANSFYGYLGYARSRWYSRECAESTTAWGRMHIQNAIKMAEEEGFKVLYADTDSLFLLMEGKSKEDVLEFMEHVNKNLPEKMELELENFYKRAVFVSKKSEKRGAKKKYALLAEDGTIKIRGFELVRRDWSPIARETQKKVLESILKKGSKEEAVAIVREIIEDIKRGKVPLEKMAITTQINKRLEDYEATGPELVAAKRLKAAGKPVSKGAIIRYVITSKGNSISDKAYPLELAEDYDPSYYVNNQILPAVMKLLKELGVDEEQLKTGLKQGKLSSFF